MVSRFSWTAADGDGNLKIVKLSDVSDDDGLRVILAARRQLLDSAWMKWYRCARGRG